METGEGFFIDVDELRVHVERLLRVLDQVFDGGGAQSLLAHPGALRHVTTARVGGPDAAHRSSFGALNDGIHCVDEVNLEHFHAHEAILGLAFELKAGAEDLRRVLPATIEGYQRADQDVRAKLRRAHDDLYDGPRW